MGASDMGKSARERYGNLHIDLDDATHQRMSASFAALSKALDAGHPVYGVSRGFGPLARFAADADIERQGLGLISHLLTGQGGDLDVETTQLMLELRLTGMTRGFSGIDPGRWAAIVDMVKAGFLPVVPALGSVSASGDLIPLAHAASAMSGRGFAWDLEAAVPVKVPAAERLYHLGLEPFRWTAREALAFVNGTSASLAAALRNQSRICAQCWAASALTGVIVDLLHASAEPYDEMVAVARGGSRGHFLASSWIRGQISTPHTAGTARQLQEPYSLRCAPQVIGGVLDFLDATAALLDGEASGCSDNPIVSAEGILHAGNFYAATAGLASDQHATLVHQVAFMAERQLALIVNPTSNGGLNPLLASRPGATSGLAGVQIAATAFLAEIRQRATPATTTPVPTNLDNQDVVPMALLGALRVAQQLELSSLVLGSLGIAAAQLAHVTQRQPLQVQSWFAAVMEGSPRLEHDRPLSDEVRAAASRLELEGARRCHATSELSGGLEDWGDR